MDDVTKTCKKCQVEQTLDSYSKSTRYGGHLIYCRSCVSATNSASHLRHLEKRHAASLEHRKSHRAEAAATSKRWREANPERNKEMVRRYRANNAEKVAADLARWHKANPSKVKAHRLRRRANIRNAVTIPFTADQLTARLAYFGNKCWMCGGAYEHLDHVKPVSRGGINALANFRPACARCNLSKNDKWYGVAELHRFVRN